jgi:diacylglycerol kinase (ATP)
MMPSVQKIAILVNETARQGRAGAIWQKAEAEILAFLPKGILLHRFRPPFDMEAWVREASAAGVNCFISAGGDGSANFLLNALLNVKKTAAEACFIGAIGLGSSNDFLKPFGKKIAGLPLRLDWQNRCRADVGRVIFKDEDGHTVQRFFIVNSGLGVTAAANYRFNHPDFLLKILKRHWTGGAIFWVALRSILSWRNLPAQLVWEDTAAAVQLSNLAVLKNPYVSGEFKYDQKIEPDDRLLGVNYCSNMGTVELLQTLADLSKGLFSGKPKRFSFTTRQIEIHTDRCTPLEMDGEVYLGKDICFSVMPQAIHLLGHGFSLPLNSLQT